MPTVPRLKLTSEDPVSLLHIASTGQSEYTSGYSLGYLMNAGVTLINRGSADATAARWDALILDNGNPLVNDRHSEPGEPVSQRRCRPPPRRQECSAEQTERQIVVGDEPESRPRATPQGAPATPTN
jgi:hypothetical protein